MELILISSNKLKIMLDESDMKQYKISDDTDCAELAARKAIRSILDTAREQVGFNTEGSEIFVQLYTSKRGGCELFVSKSELSERDAKNSGSTEADSPEKKQKKKAPQGPAYEQKKYSHDTSSSKALCPTSTGRAGCGRMAFSFASSKALFSVCRILRSRGILPDSRAYCDQNGKYYLLLTGTGMAAYSRLDKLTFILEYGKRENPEHLCSYINERCREICAAQAIETLADF